MFSQRECESSQIYFSDDLCTISRVLSIPENIKQLSVKYPEVFKGGLGKCTKMKAHISLKPGVAGRKFFKPREIPYSKLEGTKAEVERLVAQEFPIMLITVIMPILLCLFLNPQVKYVYAVILKC